ncbi:MAG TPA: acylphosphatase [Chlorobaculum sp.]|jgi:acylphosphatase|uniref:Acylphosphatase n=1 Tax=Chlorobaculum tepidum (strain ATCC 49652 / DSM 12025 / NBRC 103806 / TLS) TaxID=194439 RepID=ACYP_CHLTE|nr:acylphosphatase [Chlorobaculum tepidum]Q8KG42.1 RecName: Full=Acylphosphatase; AltName: Full=Acylphosphate phosphohydrolase [Chlorobaculum tepidum TLS]AAM71374.1 acylphosphatase [Chlorobaculum tepidum TLS]HBU24385.1 acylphosphatase [Chlorobaculum sp.]
MTEKRVHIIVSGLVQGVGFRMFVLREASARSLSGWTRNLPDGTVEVEAQGDSGRVDELIRQIRIGPSRSSVTSIKVKEIEVDTSCREFRILT